MSINPQPKADRVKSQPGNGLLPFKLHYQEDDIECDYNPEYYGSNYDPQIFKIALDFPDTWINVEHPEASVPLERIHYVCKWVETSVQDVPGIRSQAFQVAGVDWHSKLVTCRPHTPGTPDWKVKIHDWSAYARPLTDNEAAALEGRLVVDFYPASYDGKGCPFCSADDDELIYGDYEQVTTLELQREISCRQCEAVWSTNYQMTDITYETPKQDQVCMEIDDYHNRRMAVMNLYRTAKNYLHTHNMQYRGEFQEALVEAEFHQLDK